MHRILVALVLALGLAAPAHAFEEGRARSYNLGTLMTAVPLDGSGASLTFNIDVQEARAGYDVAKVTVTHANTSGALTIAMACFEDTAAGGAVTVALQDCTISTGTCTSSDATWQKAVTGAKSWVWRIDVAGYEGQVNCTFSAAGSAATDTVGVTGRLVTK